jgi:hypothetical protein
MIERTGKTTPIAVHKELEAHPEEYGLEKVLYDKDRNVSIWTYKDFSKPTATKYEIPKDLTEEQQEALRILMKAGAEAKAKGLNPMKDLSLCYR